MQQYYCPQCYGKNMMTVKLEKIGEIENTKTWLEKHAHFNRQAQYWFE